eukprot:157091-Pelagomonas_calceolata.AAC.1
MAALDVQFMKLPNWGHAASHLFINSHFEEQSIVLTGGLLLPTQWVVPTGYLVCYLPTHVPELDCIPSILPSYLLAALSQNTTCCKGLCEGNAQAIQELFWQTFSRPSFWHQQKKREKLRDKPMAGGVHEGKNKFSPVSLSQIHKSHSLHHEKTQRSVEYKIPAISLRKSSTSGAKKGGPEARSEPGSSDFHLFFGEHIILCNNKGWLGWTSRKEKGNAKQVVYHHKR